MENENQRTCIICKKADTAIPLLQLSYNGKPYWTCPEHMPLFIHQPDKLVGIIPGAENMQAG